MTNKKKKMTSRVLVCTVLLITVLLSAIGILVFGANTEIRNVKTVSNSEEVGIEGIRLNFENGNPKLTLPLNMIGGYTSKVDFTSFLQIELVNANVFGDGKIYGQPEEKNITLENPPDVKNQELLISCGVSLNFVPNVKIRTKEIESQGYQYIGNQHNVCAVFRSKGALINGVNYTGFLGKEVELLGPEYCGNYTKDYAVTTGLINNKLTVEYDLLYFDDENIGSGGDIGGDCIGVGSYSAVRHVKYDINFNVEKADPLTEEDYEITAREKRGGIYYLSDGSAEFLKLKEKTVTRYECKYCRGTPVCIGPYDWRCASCGRSLGSDKTGNYPTELWKEKTVFNSSIKVGEKAYLRNYINANDVASRGKDTLQIVTPILWNGVNCESVKAVVDTIKPVVTHNDGTEYGKSVNLGGFNTPQSFNFNENLSETQSSESATVTFYPGEKEYLRIKTSEDGETRGYRSGEELTENGKYVLTVTDACGNKTEIEFYILLNHTGYNLGRITDYSFLDVDSYSVGFKGIPGSVRLTENGKLGSNSFRGLFDNSKIYLFKNYEEALKLAEEVETEFYVNRTSRNSWSYKVPNSSLTMEYTDVDLLNTAIEFYAEKYVSETAVKRESPYVDFKKVVVMEDCLRLNNANNTPLIKDGEKAYCVAGEFVFVKNTITTNTLSDGFKDSLNLLLTEISGGKIVNADYNVPLSEMKFADGNYLTSGYYRVTEQDSFGNVSSYVLYLDLDKSTLIGELKNGGEITVRDINFGDTNDLYVESFAIKNANAGSQSEWLFVEINNSANSSQNGIYYGDFPTLNSADGKGGKCKIKIWDRALNAWEFEFYIAGESPRASFIVMGEGDEAILKVNINQGANYNIITGLQIFRDGIQLTHDDGTEKQTPTGVDGEPSKAINFANTTYYFTTSGVYFIVITDNFGRTSFSPKLIDGAAIGEDGLPSGIYMKEYGYAFIKNAPEVTLSGVRDGGRTGNNVVISIPLDCDYILTFNGATSDLKAVTDNQLQIKKISIEAGLETSGQWKFKAIRAADSQSFKTVEFWINRYPLNVTLIDIVSGGKIDDGGYSTNGIKFRLEADEESNFASAEYRFNDGKYTSYLGRSGELKRTGRYELIVTDKQGNKTTLFFTIDNSVEYVFLQGGKEDDFVEITETVDDKKVVVELKTEKAITLKTLEEVQISALFNGNRIAFVSGQTANDEGLYEFVLTDRFGNTVSVKIEIDRTAPQAEISCAGKTKDDVTLKFLSDDIEYIRATLNGSKIDLMSKNEYLFSHEGKYEITLKDDLKNETVISFEIDRSCDFSANIFDGGIASGVTIKLNEKLTVDVKRYGEKLNLENGGNLNFKEVGEYEAEFTDELGNRAVFSFLIIPEQLTEFEFGIPGNMSVNAKKDGKKIDVVVIDDRLKLSDDGKYELTFQGFDGNKKYSLSFTIDSTPPKLQMTVKNGGMTRSTVKFGEVSEKCDIRIYKDGKLTSLTIKDSIKKQGKYKIVLTDSAGNTTEYAFTKKYALNAGAILVLLLAVGFLTWGIIRLTKIKRTKMK